MEDLFFNAPWTPHFDTHPSSDKAALDCVIVEPRCHANLGGVLRNMSCMLPNAALTVYHSRENESVVREILGENHTAKLVCFTESNITRRQYCDLLCDPAFWDSIASPRALIFQTDSGVRKNTVLRFMEFDYIGAPWSWPVRGDAHITIGNGGFSLRNPRVMKEICANFARDPRYPDMDLGEPEDVFYGRTMVNINHVSLPTYEEACAFSVEHNTHPDPFGFHQAYGFQHPPALVEHWMRDTDLKESDYILKVTDAWISSEAGRQCSTPELVQWASLGIGPAGFRMPSGTLVSAIPFDIHPGYRKCLHVRFSNKKEMRVQLYQNRCKEDINVPV